MMLTAVTGGRSPSEPASAQWISQLIRQKHQEKERLITEPELMPLVKRTMGFESALKKSGRIFMKILKRLSASAATGWLLSAGLLYCGLGSRMLVRGLAMGGLMSKTPEDREVARASRLATAVSLLGAGGAVFLSAYATRLAQLWEDGPCSHTQAVHQRWRTAGGPRPFEPEREESPAESEVAVE